MLLLRLFFTFFLFFILLNAEENPRTFAQLGTPLYESVQKLSKFSNITTLSSVIQDFSTKANTIREYGLNVDNTQDTKEQKNYLLKLRKLQKNYDFTLHLLHDEIDKSIQNKDYNTFVKLTSCELDGLLKNRNLYNKAVEFYAQNKTKQVCKVLDKKIKNEKLLEETSQEFFNEIDQSTYISNAGDKTPKKSVYITAKRELNKISISLVNTNFYDVTVHVTNNYVNITPIKESPTDFVLKAKSTHKYATLLVEGKQASYSYSYSWIIGNKDAMHNDAYLYRFPYEVGTSHIIAQGYNGKYTHKGHSQYALDFGMPEGTKVCAAREGVVVRTKSDSNRGGFDKKFASDGNYVTIAHNDGTMATYYHLRRNGVVVNVGEKVQRGRVIGYSGNTGYSSGPHLHFAVFKAKNANTTQSIATKFIAQRGEVQTPLGRQKYIAK